jgi:type II secretory pathway pseudopilin PulG
VHRQRGFTYLGLIVLVTIIGLVGALTLKADALLRRAAAEEELLETGAMFSAALQSYASVTPPGQPPLPPTLQDLLRDPRFPDPRRHLRKIFVDPMTGKDEWGVVYANGEKGVVAVYSLSQAKPLKIANFDARFANFDNKEHISDWKFTATGQGVLKVAVTTDRRRPDRRHESPPVEPPQVEPPRMDPQPPEPPEAEPREPEPREPEPQPPAPEPPAPADPAPAEP